MRVYHGYAENVEYLVSSNTIDEHFKCLSKWMEEVVMTVDAGMTKVAIGRVVKVDSMLYKNFILAMGNG